MLALTIIILAIALVTTVRLLYNAGKSGDFWFGQAYYWRHRAIQAEEAGQKDGLWRASYERAMALPSWSEEGRLEDLWARAYQGDQLAIAILCEKMALDIEVAPETKK